jgi:thioredoxin 1
VRLDVGHAPKALFFPMKSMRNGGQERIITDLRASSPRYDAELTLIRVDWDLYGTGELSRALAVPRRSTLIAFNGETELARIVAGTNQAEIKALMDRALNSQGS